MKISIIGTGAIGGAMTIGLINKGVNPQDLSVSDPSQAVIDRFAEMGVRASTSNVEAIRDTDMVVIVVKPWVVQRVIDEIKPHLDYSSQTVVVIAAGISSADLKTWLDKKGSLPQVALAIPNTAVEIGESMTFIVPVNNNTLSLSAVTDLFEMLGQTIQTEEWLLKAGTALASSGIAYAMRYIRAAIEGGVELGFKATDAQQIVIQTVKGAAGLLSRKGSHPEREIDKVTTPGGVTIRGLNEMETAGFTSAVIRGLRASIKV